MADPAQQPPVRRIIHIDMDAFYASVEQRDNPQLRGRPVAVGGSRERGVVAAASYEARRFGVRSAMPSSIARRKCPELLFVAPRFDAYRAVSQEIHAIFARYTPLIQPLSLDEAYLDVTQMASIVGSATKIAQEIRAEIHARTGLTASAGVSYNRFLAKLASDYRKPDGLFVITPAMGPGFVRDLEVDRFHGIGPATARKMHALGLKTGHDLSRQSLEFLVHHFGKAGRFYHDIARGQDERPVEAERVRKSLGSETTFERDLHDEASAQQIMQTLTEKVWSQAGQRQIFGRTVTIKVKYANFRQVTRSRSEILPIGSVDEFRVIAQSLLGGVFPLEQGVRLLGVTLCGLVNDQGHGNDAPQMTLAL